MKAMPGANERLEEVNSALTAAMVVRISEMLLANIDCQGFDTLNDGGLQESFVQLKERLDALDKKMDDIIDAVNLPKIVAKSCLYDQGMTIEEWTDKNKEAVE